MATATEHLVTISKYSTTKTRLTTIYSCTELLSFDNALTFGNNRFQWRSQGHMFGGGGQNHIPFLEARKTQGLLGGFGGMLPWGKC
jgi:hypothetical protein